MTLMDDDMVRQEGREELLVQAASLYQATVAVVPADMPLVVNGPPESKEILEQMRGVHVHLSGLSGLIDATRKAYAVVGVDSGPMHLAAALAKPGIAIFGPTDPARNGPYGGSLRVLRSPSAVTTYKRLSNDDAMRAITPAAVADALALELVSKSAGCSV